LGEGTTRSLPGGKGNAVFHALTVVFVPEAAALTDQEWNSADEIISRALAARPAATRRQINLFLRMVSVLALVRYGRPLVTLTLERRTRLLESLGKSRLLLLRRGVWGVRTLAFMGYYARPEAAASIGYRASAAGWEARRVPQPR